MSAMLRSKKLSFRLVPASALIAIAAVCWSPVASAGPLTDYLTGIGVKTTDLNLNDRAAGLWAPTTAGVASEVVDYSGGNLRTGAGYGGQPYDLEALYVQKVGNSLVITGVAGAPPSQMQSLVPCPGSTPCTPGITSTYGMGDFFLGSLSTSGSTVTYSPTVGLETTGQHFNMNVNGSGSTVSYTTPLKAGDLVSLKGSVTTSGTVTCATACSDATSDALNGWERGLSNWSNKPAPSQIAASVTQSFGSATMQYEQFGTGPHYIYQATIQNFASLGLGNDITVHWGEICGNDWLRTTANVPLPSSLALFLLGGAGLAAGTRRRRV
jgi:hypothetical protein